MDGNGSLYDGNMLKDWLDIKNSVVSRFSILFLFEYLTIMFLLPEPFLLSDPDCTDLFLDLLYPFISILGVKV